MTAAVRIPPVGHEYSRFFLIHNSPFGGGGLPPTMNLASFHNTPSPGKPSISREHENDFEWAQRSPSGDDAISADGDAVTSVLTAERDSPVDPCPACSNDHRHRSPYHCFKTPCQFPPHSLRSCTRDLRSLSAPRQKFQRFCACCWPP